MFDYLGNGFCLVVVKLQSQSLDVNEIYLILMVQIQNPTASLSITMRYLWFGTFCMEIMVGNVVIFNQSPLPHL